MVEVVAVLFLNFCNTTSHVGGAPAKPFLMTECMVCSDNVPDIEPGSGSIFSGFARLDLTIKRPNRPKSRAGSRLLGPSKMMHLMDLENAGLDRPTSISILCRQPYEDGLPILINRNSGSGRFQLRS